MGNFENFLWSHVPGAEVYFSRDALYTIVASFDLRAYAFIVLRPLDFLDSVETPCHMFHICNTRYPFNDQMSYIQHHKPRSSEPDVSINLMLAFFFMESLTIVASVLHVEI